MELREQDGTLRQVVLDSSRRFGLAVVGYSGRDSSVMETLHAAVRTVRALPAGLWWMTRDPQTVLPAVTKLLSAAVAVGVPTKLVQIDNFDELLAALAAQATLDAPLRAHIDTFRSRARVIDAAMPTMDAGELPALRLNALPVLEAPRRALQTRLPEGLDIPAMRDALQAAGWRGAAVASGIRVIALGSAGQLAEALGLPSPPTEVPLDCLSQDATILDQALGYEALTRALARRLPVRSMVRDRGHRLIVRPTSHNRSDSASDATARAALVDAYGQDLTGTAPPHLGLGPDGQPRVYAEAVRLSVEWRLGLLWLLFIPHTWVSPPQTKTDTRRGHGDPASAWRKERWVNRRNEKWSAILSTWAQLLAPAKQTVIPVLSASDARRDLTGGQFILSKITAYSRVAR